MRVCLLVMLSGLLVCPADVCASQTAVSPMVEVEAWRTLAEAIPPGSQVKLQTRAGKRLAGTLMSVTDDAVLVKRNTRLPEPAFTIRFEDIARMERDQNRGFSIGKAIGVGLAAGAGAMLTLFALAALAYND